MAISSMPSAAVSRGQKRLSCWEDMRALQRTLGVVLKRVCWIWRTRSMRLRNAPRDSATLDCRGAVTAQRQEPHRGGGFARRVVGEVLVFHGGDFDVDIDAVEEGAGNAVAVALDVGGTAAALTSAIRVRSRN